MLSFPVGGCLQTLKLKIVLKPHLGGPTSVSWI